MIEAPNSERAFDVMPRPGGPVAGPLLVTTALTCADLLVVLAEVFGRDGVMFANEFTERLKAAAEGRPPPDPEGAAEAPGGGA